MRPHWVILHRLALVLGCAQLNGGLPPLSFFLLVPMFLFVARETTCQELADFVGQRTF
jgi:hypothetical protein